MKNNKEKRIDKLLSTIKCPVCQGQTIADSDNIIAKQIKQIVIEKVNNNEGDEKIIEHLKSQYGQEISLDPNFEVTTALLWIIPLIVAIIFMAYIIKFFKAKSL